MDLGLVEEKKVEGSDHGIIDIYSIIKEFLFYLTIIVKFDLHVRSMNYFF